RNISSQLSRIVNITDDIAGLRRILARYRSIAVVGISANWYRPSYFAAKYMLDHGYQIFPVNPNYSEVLGRKCYPTIAAIPDSVDSIGLASTPARSRHDAPSIHGGSSLRF